MIIHPAVKHLCIHLSCIHGHYNQIQPNVVPFLVRSRTRGVYTRRPQPQLVKFVGFVCRSSLQLPHP